MSRRLACAPRSYTEWRDGRALAVWGDVPYWVVGDREMDSVLGALDGRRTLGEVLDAVGASPAARREVAAACARLLKAGVLHDLDGPPAPSAAPAHDSDPIESVALNLTRRCNLRCRCCYALADLRFVSDRSGELAASEVRAFLRAARPLLSRRAAVVILGGEPLLEPNRLLAVAAGARRLGLSATMSTNGTHVTPGFARAAARAGLEVQVSFDGPDADTHDAVRGSGVFDRATAAVRTLKRGGVHVILNLVCHRATAGRLEAFLDLATALGADEARFIPLKQLGGARPGAGTLGAAAPGASVNDAPAAGAPPLWQIVAEALALLRRRPKLARLLGRDALSILANTCRYSVRRPSCGTGRQTVLLDADGSVYPCLNTLRPELRLGNVRDPGFDFVRTWRESPVLRAVRAATDVTAGPCRACPVRHWCLGGCHGETLAATGRLDARSPHCADLRRSVIEMMWTLTDAPAVARRSTFIC